MLTYEKVERIAGELKNLICSDPIPLQGFRIHYGEEGPEQAKQQDFSDWEPYDPRLGWTGRDSHAWFYKKLSLPSGWKGKPLALRVTTGFEGQWDATNPQFLLFVNGAPLQGLDTNHTLALLPTSEKGLELLFWGYSGPEERRVGFSCELSPLDQSTAELYYHLSVPLEIAGLLPGDDLKRLKILGYLDRALGLLDLRRPFSDSYYHSLEAALKYLNEEFYQAYCGSQEVTALCVGHTHIDVAWLWRIRQTREKVARSFATVLALMREYPGFVFMHSQPVLYRFLKEDFPELFRELKRRVQEGAWEPEGAMWLESDTVLAGGESLVRQILYGKRFFREEFGVDSEVLWLPDVFGYSPALPQILVKSGIKYFTTTKISWSQFNKFPYDTFLWRGIDGSEILTYFISTMDYRSDSFRTSYEPKLAPSQVMGAWKRYQQKDLNQEILICYGHGDGGGGPTREMLEQARRMARGIPGCPQVKLGKVLPFFRALEERLAEQQARVPRWVGELYLEYHRGTYTSMARNKRYHRQAETLLNQAELAASMAWCLGYRYPGEALRECWETLLLNQFHDILPGTSIKEVYRDSWQDYQGILKRAEAAATKAWTRVLRRVDAAEPGMMVINTASHSRDDLVLVDLPPDWQADTLVVKDGDEELPAQRVIDREGKDQLLFLAPAVPAKGYRIFSLQRVESASENESPENAPADSEPLAPDPPQLTVTPSLLENRFFRIAVNERGEFSSLYDKGARREVLVPGTAGNVLQAFEDKPIAWDAWDIDYYYQDKMWPVEAVEGIRVIEQGPVRRGIQVIKRFMDSTIEQRIYIYADLPRIDVENHVQWKERQILLKVAFPVEINAERATYNIQFGNIERPTHWNTIWERAKFEVWAHWWADLSEEGYGVSLINDCKYGYDIRDRVMRLTLIKSAKHPNPEADLGEHNFRYALYPHRGGWRTAGTVAMGYSLNHPLRGMIVGPRQGEESRRLLPAVLSLVSVDAPGVIVDSVKKAEEEEALVIRLYEAYNQRGWATIHFAFPLTEVRECDLLEGQGDPVALEEPRSFPVFFKPYEIKTFKVKARSGAWGG